MSWSLRTKTNDEIMKEKQYKRGYGAVNPQVCPLEVTFGDGTKCDVSDLTESQIGGLFVTMSESFESNKKNMTEVSWAFKIISMWRESHPQVSADFAARLYELKMSKTGPAKEIIRDLAGDMISVREDMATEVARLNAREKGSDDRKISQQEILDALKAEAQIEKNNKERDM